MSHPAPGAPGSEPFWTSSQKMGLGTSLNPSSQTWFTLAKGVVTEVYYPSIDTVALRQLLFLVVGPDGTFYSEKRDCDFQYKTSSAGVPCWEVTTTAKDGAFQIRKTVYTDPYRNALIVEGEFIALKGEQGDYTIYLHVNPHLRNYGYGNSGFVDDYKGVPMLFAEKYDFCVAAVAEPAFKKRTVGYVGVSDGWEQLSQSGELKERYTEATEGNIGLTGQLETDAHGKFRIVVGFGRTRAIAAQLARASLTLPDKEMRESYVRPWMEVQRAADPIFKQAVEPAKSLLKTSLMVLKAHQTKIFRGSIIASLSIPWGGSRADKSLGGYHLVWPRDLVESAFGLAAVNDLHGARQVLHYLMCTQEADGHWAQNMWVDGSVYWTGVQMDETALPILLASYLKKKGALGELDPWLMVKRAAEYVAKNGPMTQEDRWEENAGYTPFTLAAEIAALVIASDFYRERGLEKEADYLLDIADRWNDHIEERLYVKDTPLSRELGIEGYYVRITEEGAGLEGEIPIRNRAVQEMEHKSSEIVSTDALAFVRFGLRRANDPRMLNTVKAIDATLIKETKRGPVWLRYRFDGYGEKEDGSDYDGTGVGRGWPLLVGERAHYELAKGDTQQAEHLFSVMGNFASTTHLIPEQVWDSPDIPEKGLFNGEPTASAMPLVWAHGEYLKLWCSLQEKRLFDLPPEVAERYHDKVTKCHFDSWRFNHKIRKCSFERTLRFELLAPAKVRYSIDGWETTQEKETHDTGLGIHYLDIPQDELEGRKGIEFTFYWSESDQWEETNFSIEKI